MTVDPSSSTPNHTHFPVESAVNELSERVEGKASMSASPARRILLVEDDEILRRNYELLLAAHHFYVRGCADKDEASKAFSQEPFDVAILDVTLGADTKAGFSLCQILREKNKALPIIFLTERSEDYDRISGLRLGADDYLNKTVSETYLVARINALIRRVETLVGTKPDLAVPDRWSRSSQLRIDDQRSQAFWKGEMLHLSLTQFWILKDLFENSGQVRSTSDLMRAARVTVQPNTIVVHIKAIREEIQRVSPEFSAIKSERARLSLGLTMCRESAVP